MNSSLTAAYRFQFMKSVFRTNGGPTAPTSMSSKKIRSVTLGRSSVPDGCRQPTLQELARLIAPLRLVVEEEHETEPAHPLVPPGEARPLGDDVTGPDAPEEGVHLAPVEHVAALGRGFARYGAGGGNGAGWNRPGEGVEVLGGHDAAPPGGSGERLVPEQPGRRLRPVDGDRPPADVRGRDRIGDGLGPPAAPRGDQLWPDEGRHCRILGCVGHGTPLCAPAL